jgi:hypothetical protein
MYKKNKIQSEKEIFFMIKREYKFLFLWFAICLLILISGFTSIVSAKDKQDYNIDFFCGWDGYFRPMEWTPVEITVNSTLEIFFGGEITLTSQQDGLNTLNIVQDCTLTPGLPEYKPLVTKIAYATQKCSLKLDQTDGRRRKTVWNHDFDIWRTINSKKSTYLNEQDILIGIVEMGKFGLLRLDKQSFSQYRNQRGTVCIGTKQIDMVPWDWTGFVSLDLLILYNPDWSRFRPQQLEAIAEWISNGGKILLVLGSKPFMGQNPLTDIIPFEFLETKEVNIPQNQLYKWNMSGNAGEKVTLKPIVPKANVKISEGNVYQDNQYLFAVGTAGFGRVGVLGFDPDNFSVSQAAYSSQFWVNIIHTMIKSTRSSNNSSFAERIIQFTEDVDKPQENPGGMPQQAYYQGSYQIASAYASNNRVMEFLYSEIKPLSVWFVILLLGTLAILLGPIDYKFLKRIDRLPLTWLTCSFWIIVFTVGAYYGVQFIRGGKMQLKVVSVLDGIKDNNTAWATQYSGLFASRSDSYQIEGLKTNQWWSGIAPTQDQLYSYNVEIGSRKIYCVQDNGGNLPEALPVNIWDIQCMLTESPIEKIPFSADIQQNGENITITITNESDSAITSGYVLVSNNRGIDFGNVPANSVQTFKKQSRPIGYWGNIIRENQSGQRYIESNNMKLRNEEAFFAQGSLQRTQAMIDYINNGAAVVCVSFENAPLSFGVKDHSFTSEHIQLARLVVFPDKN